MSAPGPHATLTGCSAADGVLLTECFPALIWDELPVLSPAGARESGQQVIDRSTGIAEGKESQPQPETVQRLRPARDAQAAEPARGAPPGSGDLTDELLRSDQWTDEMVAAAGIPIIDVPFVSVGGGIGSFVTVDYLRIAGVPTDQIAMLSNLDIPWQTYEYLTRVSQIPRPERIRSDSASRPDNIWGFPSYALAEAIDAKGRWRRSGRCSSSRSGRLSTRRRPARSSRASSARPTGSVFAEMLVKGQVRMVRKRQGGGYFTILTPPAGATRDQAARLPGAVRPPRRSATRG